MVVQSPSSSSSYEDDDDNNTHTNNQESDEEVEKKTPNLKQDSDDDDEDDDEQEEGELDLQDSEDGESKKKNRYKVSANLGDSVNLNKRKFLKSVDNESIIVALNADKRPKTTTTGSVSGSNSKLNPFGKKWSNEDELVLLQGMVNFKKTNDGGLIDSTPKYDKLLESIKKSLSFAYTNKQLQNKVRSLRDKYEIVAHKLISGSGENPFENKPHEEQLYNLSKIYWEDVKIIRQKSLRKKIKKSNENSELPYYYLEQLCTVNNGSLNSLMKANAEKGWEDSIGKANAVKLNQKAKDLMIAEVEVYLKRCQLIKDTTKLLLGGLKQ